MVADGVHAPHADTPELRKICGVLNIVVGSILADNRGRLEGNMIGSPNDIVVRLRSRANAHFYVTCTFFRGFESQNRVAGSRIPRLNPPSLAPDQTPKFPIELN